MLYYSYISKHTVTELEAHIELFDVTARWFYWAHPDEDFDEYIRNNSEKLTVSNSRCFNVISE